MTIIAERGLFVRLLVQSGKFETASAEALADALDAATRESATRADLMEVRGDLKSDIADGRAELAATRNEAKADIAALRAEMKTEIALLRSELTQLRGEVRAGDTLVAQQVQSLAQLMQAQTDKLLVRLGGLMIAIVGLAFAALRLT